MRRVASTVVRQAMLRRCAPLVCGFAASPSIAPPTLAMAMRPMASDSLNEFDDDGFDAPAFDSTATLASEHIAQNRDSIIEDLLKGILPESVTDAQREAARKYINANPMDEAISAQQCVITHVEDENGKEVRIKNMPPNSREESIKSARDQGKYLIQFVEKDGKAYCRIRNEKERILKHIGFGEIATEEVSAGEQKPAGKQARKLREQQVHVFRDVVNDHFIGWKSEKIVKELENGHPVKLSIQKFSSPDAALSKMRQMMFSIRQKAEERNSIHICKGFVVSDKELGIDLQPSLEGTDASKGIKHPSDKDWDKLENRFLTACRKSGRDNLGTYQKRDVLKPTRVGARQFRVDKYGRRIE